MSRSWNCTLAIVLTACFPSDSAPAGEEKKSAEKASATERPPLRDLLVWNEATIFGGKLTLDGEDRFAVLFDKPGQMAAGFEGQFIYDEKSPEAQGSNRKFFTRDKDQVIPGLAAIGISPPTSAWTAWTSRFPVAGDVRVKMDFRIPNFLTEQSGFVVRVNWTKDKWLETQFFNSASKQAFGKTLAMAQSQVGEYKRPPPKWFPRKEGKEQPVEIGVEGGKLKVSFAGKDLVTLDKVSDVPRGKVAFAFRKLAFTIQKLQISGVLDKAWCEAEVNRLEKAGKLKLKPPEDPNAPPPEPVADPKPAADAEGKKKADGDKEL
jgi:hypothetical protein